MRYIILILIFITACEKPAKETTQDGNFTIEFLFEKDGCKMYRFSDGGRNIYWANCEGKVNADYSTSNGKTTTTHRRESITTKPLQDSRIY